MVVPSAACFMLASAEVKVHGVRKRGSRSSICCAQHVRDEECQFQRLLGV